MPVPVYLANAKLMTEVLVFLDEMLASAANVNFTAGASLVAVLHPNSRGWFIRSQFVDPINPSVGLVIDGINYSGLGGSSLLFDVNQVEILSRSARYSLWC